MVSTEQYNANNLSTAAFAELDNPCNAFLKITNVKTELLWGATALSPTPHISIVIPTFQRQAYFTEALDSVLCQFPTEEAWECLVIDNTPLDKQGTTFALEAIRKRNDPRVLYYLNCVNIGPGYNWNRGVELARGKWVMFLHDDDILYPDALKQIGRIIRDHEEKGKTLGYIHARRDSFSVSSELKTLHRVNVPYYETLTRFRALIMGESGTGMPSCGTTILKQAYCEVGGINYDFGLTADAVLGYQIMKNFKVIVSDVALGAYRWADNETLKVESLRNLIHSDYLFAQYRYSRNAFSKLWGTLFWKAELSENIRYKLNTGKKKQLLLTPQELCRDIPYAPAGRFCLLLYKILRKIFWLCRNATYRLTKIQSADC